MTSRTDIPAKDSNIRHLSEDVIRAIGQALREELDAGRSVRIRKLGMWTPYISDDGRQTVVFHSEINLHPSAEKGRQKEMNMNTTDIDIPFVDGDIQAHKVRPGTKAQLIDVQLLFDEVREEFGLVDLPGSKKRDPEDSTETQSGDTVKTRVKETIPSAASPEETAEDPGLETIPDLFESYEDTPPAPLQIDELQESEDIFRMNRNRLFNPPEPRKSSGLRIAAMIMTALMIAMVGYMVYSSGMLNGFLPDNMKYRPAPMERRVPRPVPPSAG